MDSLVANYASSDEEGEDQPSPPPLPPPPSTTKSSSAIFSSLPQPKHLAKNPNSVSSQKPPTSTSASSLFSSLPQPQISTSGKRVVKYIPPVINTSIHDDDDDDEEEERKRAKKKKESESQSVSQTGSVKSFLSSIPAPRSSANLGVASSRRRSIIETQALDLSTTNNDAEVSHRDLESNSNSEASFQNHDVGNYSSYEAGVENYANYDQSSSSYVNYEQSVESYGNYDQSNVNYGVGSDNLSVDKSSYVNYGVGSDNWSVDQSSYVKNEQPAMNGIMPRKRGRNEIPTEIIEVKQDELMKNRPRQDQAKLTGIAFGPAYQVSQLCCTVNIYAL